GRTPEAAGLVLLAIAEECVSEVQLDRGVAPMLGRERLEVGERIRWPGRDRRPDLGVDGVVRAEEPAGGPGVSLGEPVLRPPQSHRLRIGANAEIQLERRAGGADSSALR